MDTCYNVLLSRASLRSNDTNGHLLVEYRASFTKSTVITQSRSAAAVAASLERSSRAPAVSGSGGSSMSHTGAPLSSAAAAYCLQLGGQDSLLDLTYNCSNNLTMSCVDGTSAPRPVPPRDDALIDP